MTATVTRSGLDVVLDGLAAGRLVPFLAPEVVLLEPANAALPARPDVLIQRLSRRVPVPGRFRGNLSAAAQYIETFRHRKVLRNLMCEAFAEPARPTPLHRWLAGLRLPLIVDLGYDAAMAAALAEVEGLSWGQTQGISRAESRAGQGIDWHASYHADDAPCAESASARWQTLLYKPVGSITPAGHFIVSDADFVEVMTEIDIQTPIPAGVQARRAPRGFVFIGGRFNSQGARTWARQLMKRAAGPHYALIDGELSRMEERFVAAQGIVVVPASAAGLMAAVAPAGN